MKTEKTINTEQASDTVAALTAETIDRLIEEAQVKQHPYGKVWQRFDFDTFNQLVGDVECRGLDQEILVYQGMVLEGWHRYLACLATKTTPKFAEFQGSDLEAAERVHASGIRRQSTPEQRYASFDMLCDACPEFKAKYEELKEKGVQQQQAGKPLSTDGQRVDVVGAKAAAAGVSRSTAAKVEQVKKQKPEAVADIAGGKTSANKVLKDLKEEQTPDDPDDGDEAELQTDLDHATSQATDADQPERPKELKTDAWPDLLEKVQAVTRLLHRANESVTPEQFSEITTGVKKTKAIVISHVRPLIEALHELDRAEDTFLIRYTNRLVPHEPSSGGGEKFQDGCTTEQGCRSSQGELPSSEITIRKLNSLYGKHAVDLLDSFLEELNREDGAMRIYKVVKPLPSQDEFKELQKQRYTSTVADLVDIAFGTFEDLAGEVGDWYDNMPEGFQTGDKGSALDDARNTLESLSQPDVDERLGALEVYYEPIHEVRSRSSRRDDAVCCLQAVVDVLAASDHPEAKDLIDELENAIGEAESVEFPGMY